MLVELRHIRGDRLLHRVDLEDPPQPGRWLVVEQQSFLVMQRRHRYALRNGRYVMASVCLLYTSPSPRDGLLSRMPSSA